MNIKRWIGLIIFLLGVAGLIYVENKPNEDYDDNLLFLLIACVIFAVIGGLMLIFCKKKRQ